MMRNGKPLGRLNWETNCLYPVVPVCKEINQEEIKKMKSGYYIALPDDFYQEPSIIRDIYESILNKILG